MPSLLSMPLIALQTALLESLLVPTMADTIMKCSSKDGKCIEALDAYSLLLQ